MTVVVDASAFCELLLRSPHAAEVDRALEEDPFAPELFDVEVLHALMKFVRQGRMDSLTAEASIGVLLGVPISRLPHGELVQEAWFYRDHLSAYDAVYVVLARRLSARLITADARLARVPNIPVPVTLIPTVS